MRRSTRQIKLQAVCDGSLSNQEMKVETRKAVYHASNTTKVPFLLLPPLCYYPPLNPKASDGGDLFVIIIGFFCFYPLCQNITSMPLSTALDRQSPGLEAISIRLKRQGVSPITPPSQSPPPSVYLFSLARPLLWSLQTNNTLLSIGGGLLINLSQTVLASGPGDLD